MCGHNVYGSDLVQLGLDRLLMVVLHWFSLAWHGVLQFTFGVDVGQVSGGVASGSMVQFGLRYGSVWVHQWHICGSDGCGLSVYG